MDVFTMVLFDKAAVDVVLFGKATFDRYRQTELVLSISEDVPRFVYQPTWVVAEINRQTPKARIGFVELINVVKKARGNAVVSMRPSIDLKLDQLYEIYSREQLKLKACNKIKRAWQHVYYNPWFDVCRRRLDREFHEMVKA
jgi:hypothetical protein